MADASLADLLGPALQIGSTVLSAGSQVAKGAAAQTIAAQRQAADEFEAAQLQTEATASRGVGMRASQDQTLNTELVNSKALANAAASGAGASDPTVMNIMARTAGEGAYRSTLAMYEGEAQARLDVAKAGALQYQGAVGVAGANIAAQQSNIAAASTLLSGAVKAGSLYDRFYAGPTPTASSATGSGSNSASNGSSLDAGMAFQDAT